MTQSYCFVNIEILINPKGKLLTSRSAARSKFCYCENACDFNYLREVSVIYEQYQLNSKTKSSEITQFNNGMKTADAAPILFSWTERNIWKTPQLNSSINFTIITLNDVVKSIGIHRFTSHLSWRWYNNCNEPWLINEWHLKRFKWRRE